jgi:hypothetical protein
VLGLLFFSFLSRHSCHHPIPFSPSSSGPYCLLVLDIHRRLGSYSLSPQTFFLFRIHFWVAQIICHELTLFFFSLVFTRCHKSIEQGRRWENLCWRNWSRYTIHSPPPQLRHEQHDTMHLTESIVASSTTSSSILDSSNPTPRAWSVREGSPLTDDDHHEVHQLSIRQEGYRLDSTSSINTDSNSSRVSHITLSDSCNSTSGTSGGGHSDRQRPSSFSSMLFNHQLGSSANSVQSLMAQQPMSTSVSSIICPPPPIRLVNNASFFLGITEEVTRLRGGSGECLVVIVLLSIPGPPLLSPRSAHLFFHFPWVYLHIFFFSSFFLLFFGGGWFWWDAISYIHTRARAPLRGVRQADFSHRVAGASFSRCGSCYFLFH